MLTKLIATTTRIDISYFSLDRISTALSLVSSLHTHDYRGVIENALNLVIMEIEYRA